MSIEVVKSALFTILLVIYVKSIAEGDLEMSRSYKKTPIIKEYSPCKRYYKRQANKKIRKMDLEDVGINPGLYKKHYENWNISDYAVYVSKEEALLEWCNEFESVEECITDWKKRIIRK